jgi:hypothetical protein
MSNWHPELITINREEDYHTHYLGETEDGRLFFGYSTFAFPNGYSNEDWQKERLEYAVVYLFDKSGNYIENLNKFVGKTNDNSAGKSDESLELLMKKLGKVSYTNIKVKPFSIIIDEIKFGLIPNNETEMIELEPSSTIAFSEPWLGEYDT